MKFKLSQDNLEALLSISKHSKPKSAISDEKIQKKLLIHIRDIEKKIKYLTSNKEKAALFYEIGLIWRDQIGDTRSSIINFQKSYEADNSYLPNLKAVREIFINKKNWDFVIDIIDTELVYIKDKDEITYLISLKSEILNTYKKDFKNSEKMLLNNLKANNDTIFFTIRKLKSMYFQKNQHETYGELIDELINTATSDNVLEALLIDIITLTLQKKYTPKKEINEYLSSLFSINNKLIIPNNKINWKSVINKLRDEFNKSETFNSDNLYIIYRIYKDILKNKSEANRILIANHQNIKDNFLLLDELENHYANNYNWEKLIDIQKKKFYLLDTNEEKSNLFYKIGHIFQTKINDNKNAKKYFSQSLELLKDNISTIRALSKIAYLENNIEDLVNYHLKEIELSKNNNLNAILYFKIAEIYLKNKEYSLSEEYYLKSQEEDNSYYPTKRALLKLYRANKQWKKVISILENTIENSIDDDKILSLKIEIGKLYFRRLQLLENAIETFNNILNNYGYNMESVVYLEEIYKREKSWNELIALYEMKLNNISDQYEKINLLTNISDLFVNILKEKDKSIPYLKEILNISPSYIPALQKLSFIYKESENWNKVIELNLNEIEFIDSSQKKSILLKNIGNIYKNYLDDLSNAMKYYELSLEYNVNNFESISELEYIYNNLKLTEKLINLFNDKIENTDSNKLKSDYSCKVAELYIENHQNKAITKYIEALKYNINNKVAFEELKRLYLKNKEIKKLIDLIMEYSDIENSENNFYIAQLNYLYLNNFSKAEEYLKKAISIKKKKEYYDFLIRLYFDNNKFENVLEIKDEYIELLKEDELYAFSQYIISFSEYNSTVNYFPITEYIIIFNNNPNSHFFYKLFNLLYKNALWEDLLVLIKIRLKILKDKIEMVDLNYHIALIYEYYLKDYNKALEYYEKSITLDNNHFLSLQGKNRLYKLTGNTSGLIDMLKNEDYNNLPIDVRNDILYKNSITLIEDFNKNNDAEKLLLKILKDSPSNEKAFNKLYEIYINSYKYERLLEIINNKIPTINDLTYKESLLIKKSEIILLLNPNNTKDSIKILNSIIELNPNNLKAKINLINFYFREQNDEMVIKLGELITSQNIGTENYQKILYLLFKSYINKNYIEKVLLISDMLLERKVLSFEEMNNLLPIYKKNKNKTQLLSLLLSLINYDSEQKISYIIDYLDISKKVIDEERWHEKILNWIQITKSIEILNYYSSFFINHQNYSRAISILEENITSYKDPNIKSSIYKKLGDLYSNLDDIDKVIKHYKKAVSLNGNLVALNKLRNIFSSDDKYIEEVLSYYPKIIKENINNLFLVKDLFFIYKKLNKELLVYNTSSIIHLLKLGNNDADNIYKNLQLRYPENYNLYQNNLFIFIKSPNDNNNLRELLYIALSGLGRLTKKTVSSYKNIEKITSKNNYKIWNTFNLILQKLDLNNIDLYINKTETKEIDFIYPDNLGLIIPSSLLQMDQKQLSYFLGVQLDRLKSMNFLLNYHSVDSLIKFIKIIINYAYEEKIYSDDNLNDYYKLFSKGVSRTTRKKLYSLKISLTGINWKTFDLKAFISDSYKTSLNIGLIISENINNVVRATLKTQNLNNLTMSSDDLLEAISQRPELEEIFKYSLDNKYVALLNSLGVKLIDKK